MQYVFLSHDVDWRYQGPPIEHILARKDRFEKQVLDNIHVKNPYYNIPVFMNLEDKFGIKSTFFFRTKYENGDFMDYEDDIKVLEKGGWEIGLHTDPHSIDDFEKIRKEKNELEDLMTTKLLGNRVHYLGFNDKLPNWLQSLEFVYDSSVRKTKNLITKDEMGFFKFDQLIEFPITIMDAYLFTYMNIKEEKVIDVFKETLNTARKLNGVLNVITVNWHTNVLQMKGGRIYPKILEFLTSQDDVQICRGIDLAKMINEKSLNY